MAAPRTEPCSPGSTRQRASLQAAETIASTPRSMIRRTSGRRSGRNSGVPCGSGRSGRRLGARPGERTTMSFLPSVRQHRRSPEDRSAFQKGVAAGRGRLPVPTGCIVRRVEQPGDAVPGHSSHDAASEILRIHEQAFVPCRVMANAAAGDALKRAIDVIDAPPLYWSCWRRCSCTIGAVSRMLLGRPFCSDQQGARAKLSVSSGSRSRRSARLPVGRPPPRRSATHSIRVVSSSYEPRRAARVGERSRRDEPRRATPAPCGLPGAPPEQARRHEVRPGMTGWAQVNGRNALSWEERFDLDIWYVDHRSAALDLKILYDTLAAVLRGEGISHPGSATMPPFSGSRDRREARPRTGRDAE